jgi:hypothetical protein
MCGTDDEISVLIWRRNSSVGQFLCGGITGCVRVAFRRNRALGVLLRRMPVKKYWFGDRHEAKQKYNAERAKPRIHSAILQLNIRDERHSSPLAFRSGFPSSGPDVFQRRFLVNCDVVGPVALDQVLGLFLRSVMHVALKTSIGHHFLYNHAANSSGFRVPFDMVAAFEGFRHKPKLGLG